MTEQQKAFARAQRKRNQERRLAAKTASNEPKAVKPAKKTNPFVLAAAVAAAGFVVFLNVEGYYQVNKAGDKILEDSTRFSTELLNDIAAIQKPGEPDSLTIKSNSIPSSTGANTNHHVADNLNAADQMFANGMDGCTSVSLAITAYNSLGPTDVPRAEIKRYADKCGLRF